VRGGAWGWGVRSCKGELAQADGKADVGESSWCLLYGVASGVGRRSMSIGQNRPPSWCFASMGLPLSVRLGIHGTEDTTWYGYTE
jgi:hypothetical protein